MVTIVVLSKPIQHLHYVSRSNEYNPFRYLWIEGETNYRIGDGVQRDGYSLEVMQIKTFQDDGDALDFIDEIKVNNPNFYEI